MIQTASVCPHPTTTKTGGGAALWAAATLGRRIAAVVSRGGRPDLAAARLPDVTAPTLLLVGGEDETVLRLNEMAAEGMTGGGGGVGLVGVGVGVGLRV